MNSKILKHHILFSLFLVLILVIQIFELKYKTNLLTLVPLVFLGLHLKFFSQHFMGNLIFISISFALGFSADSLMSNSDIYHFGIVDLPGFAWPPPWVAAIWCVLPTYLTYSVQILHRHRILGAYAGAFLAYLVYSYLGERLDLVFFHLPKKQSAIFFILIWYLMIRLFFWLHKKTNKKII